MDSFLLAAVAVVVVINCVRSTQKKPTTFRGYSFGYIRSGDIVHLFIRLGTRALLKKLSRPQ